MRRFLFIYLVFAGCTPSSIQDLRFQGEAETRRLASELRAIDTTEELSKALPRIKKRYSKLADLLLQTRKFDSDGSPEPSVASEELFAELARLYEIPGARELIEGAQSEAIRKLSR